MSSFFIPVERVSTLPVPRYPDWNQFTESYSPTELAEARRRDPSCPVDYERLRTRYDGKLYEIERIQRDQDGPVMVTLTDFGQSIPNALGYPTGETVRREIALTPAEAAAMVRSMVEDLESAIMEALL